MNNHAIIILTRKTNQPNERQDKMNDKKAAKLYEAMVNAAYDYKFEGGSKELASKAASEYAEYKGISYERACSLAVECF